MIKALIFDWHGVLDKTNSEGFVNKLVVFKKTTPENIINLIKPYERDYIYGGDPKEFWENIQKVFSLNDKELLEVENYILGIIPNKLLWEKLPSLHSSYLTAILSDCPKDKVDKIRKLNLKDFDYVYFSAEKELSKSDKDFFLNLTSEMKVLPEECLYIDDTKKHIDTTVALGFKTCLFKSIEDLSKINLWRVS